MQTDNLSKEKVMENDIWEVKAVLFENMLSSLFHEISTPISILQSEIYMALKKTPDNEYLQRIKKQIGKIREAKQRVMNITTLLSEPEVNSVRLVVYHVVSRFEKVKNRCSDKEIKIIPANVALALLPVVHNSVSCAKQIIVKDKIDWENKIITIIVEDDGPGFSEEALIKAGEKGFTTREFHSGIGLSLSKKLSKNMRISNRPEGGAKVELEFPIYD